VPIPGEKGGRVNNIHITDVEFKNRLDDGPGDLMFSFFKRRDAKIYPDDEMGNALYEHCSDPGKLPDKVGVWYDTYFDTQADADAVSRHLEQRRIEVIRDHDEEENEGYGPWNVDFELAVRARYIDLKMSNEEIKHLIADNRGKIATCHISKWDEDEDGAD